MTKRDVLDKLATEYVGDGKSNLVFVTDDDGVLAIFDGRLFLGDAKKIADSYGSPCWVEDKDGVAYDNKASRRRSEKED
jgi:hypothetical protein